MSANPNEKVIVMDEHDSETITQEMPCTNRVAIFAKIAKIMGKMERIDKSATNDYHKYKYASADAVFDACRKLMAEEKLVIIPHMDAVRQSNANTNIDFTFTLGCAETGATLDVQWEGEATDKGDKGINKCATTALKYFLMKLFVIDTGNPDNDADSGGETKQTAPPQDPITFTITKIKVTRQKKNPEQLMYVIAGKQKSAYLFSSDLFKQAGYDTRQWKLNKNQKEKEVALDPPAQVTVAPDNKGYLQVQAVSQEKPAEAKDKPAQGKSTPSTNDAKSKGQSSPKRPKTLTVEIDEFEFDGERGFVDVDEHEAIILIENPMELFEEIVEEWPVKVDEGERVSVELMVDASLTCKAKVTKDAGTGVILAHYIVTDAT